MLIGDLLTALGRLLRLAHAVCQVSQPPHARGGDGTFGVLSIARGAAHVKPFHAAPPATRRRTPRVHATAGDDRQARAGARDVLTKSSASLRNRPFPTARQDSINSRGSRGQRIDGAQWIGERVERAMECHRNAWRRFDDARELVQRRSPDLRKACHQAVDFELCEVPGGGAHDLDLRIRRSNPPFSRTMTRSGNEVAAAIASTTESAGVSPRPHRAYDFQTVGSPVRRCALVRLADESDTGSASSKVLPGSPRFVRVLPVPLAKCFRDEPRTRKLAEPRRT